ncbi:lysoplasmalogenase [Hellea sp.]|nr:lysoplasmalogenase [Hellea sp.]
MVTVLFYKKTINNLGFFIYLAYITIVSGLLVSEYYRFKLGEYIFKPLASLCFIFISLKYGALESTYGYLILISLILCALGDVLLLNRKLRIPFFCGMFVFAIAHLLFSIAFFRNNTFDFTSLFLFLPLLFILAGVNFLYLLPKIPQSFKLFVILYSWAIFIMITSAYIFMYEKKAILLAATLFVLSDIFVAKDRFIKRSTKNTFLITPTYFAAQGLFAFSVSI